MLFWPAAYPERWWVCPMTGPESLLGTFRLLHISVVGSLWHFTMSPKEIQKHSLSPAWEIITRLLLLFGGERKGVWKLVLNMALLSQSQKH